MSNRTASLQGRFGKRIKMLQESRQWGSTHLAIQRGAAKGTLLEIEKGRADLRLRTIAALAGSFGKTWSELLRGI